MSTRISVAMTTTGLWTQPTRTVYPYELPEVTRDRDRMMRDWGIPAEPNPRRDPTGWNEWMQEWGNVRAAAADEAVDLWLDRNIGCRMGDMQPDPADPMNPERRNVVQHQAEILTLALVDERGQVLLNRAYRPEHTSSWPAAQRVCGISPTDVEAEPPIWTDADEISEILQGADELLAYGSSYTGRMLKNSGIDIGRRTRRVDVMDAFSRAWGEYRGYSDPTKKSLVFAAKATGHPMGVPPRTALMNARATLAVQAELDAGWKRNESGSYSRSRDLEQELAQTQLQERRQTRS